MHEKDKGVPSGHELMGKDVNPSDIFVRDEIKNSLSSSSDYYLSHPPRQPKAEIAAYVESQGISVPNRFVSLKEAMDSGKSFIIRSEHPDEYAGSSGLLISAKIRPKDVAEIKQLITDHPERFVDKDYWRKTPFSQMFFGMLINQYSQDGSQANLEAGLTDMRREEIEDYCKPRGIPTEAFSRDISYSYWELLEGINRHIIKDDTIEKKYHIFSVKGGYLSQDYSVYDDDRLTTMTPWLPEEVRANLDQVVAFYERVKRLPHFNSGHCPSMEIQTVDNQQNLFLQYHRMHDHKPADFHLARPCEEGETEAFFVRGATPPEGIVYPVTFYGENNEGREGAHFQGVGPGLGTMYDTKMQAFLMQKGTASDFAGAIGTRHMQIIALFKPEISVVLDMYALGIDVVRLRMESSETNAPIIIPIRIISDGRRALLKVMRSV